MILSNENKMISQKVKRPFVAHRFFQINVFRILYSFFFHCVNTTDHIRWIIPSRVMLKFCQNSLHILMKLTRFSLCLFKQSLFIKVNPLMILVLLQGITIFPEIIYLPFRKDYTLSNFL